MLPAFLVLGLVVVMSEHVLAERLTFRRLTEVVRKNIAVAKAVILTKEVHPEMKAHSKAAAKMEELQVRAVVRASELGSVVLMCLSSMQLCVVLWSGLDALKGKQHLVCILLGLYGLCRYVQAVQGCLTAAQVRMALHAAHPLFVLGALVPASGGACLTAWAACTSARNFGGILLLDHRVSLCWNILIATGSCVQYVATSDVPGAEGRTGHLATHMVLEILTVFSIWVCHYVQQMFAEAWALSLAGAKECAAPHELVTRLFSSLCDADAVLDEDLHFTEATGKLARFFRTPASDLGQARLSDFLVGRDKEVFEKFRHMGARHAQQPGLGADAQSGSAPVCINLTGRDAQGGELRMRLLHVCLPRHGRPAHFVGIQEQGARPEPRAASAAGRAQDEAPALARRSDASPPGVELDVLKGVSIVFNAFSRRKEVRSATFTFRESAEGQHLLSSLATWMPPAVFEKFDGHVNTFVNNVYNEVAESEPAALDAVVLLDPADGGSIEASSVQLDFAESEKEGCEEGDEGGWGDTLHLRLDLSRFARARRTASCDGAGPPGQQARRHASAAGAAPARTLGGLGSIQEAPEPAHLAAATAVRHG